MRPIHAVRLDKTRPVLVLTREAVRALMTRVTVAPITSTSHGLSIEVPGGPANGLDKASVVSLDDILTTPVRALGRRLGSSLPEQEAELTTAIHAAFDLD